MLPVRKSERIHKPLDPAHACILSHEQGSLIQLFLQAECVNPHGDCMNINVTVSKVALHALLNTIQSQLA